MKRNTKCMLALSLTLLLAGLTSCGDKKTSTSDTDSIESPERSEENTQTLIELNAFNVTESVQMNGHKYTYTIERTPLDSVIVTDEEGYKSRDNSLRLTILRDDAPFFQRNFTRSAFHIRVSDAYYQQCILLGMNFDRVNEYGLQFLASIGKGADSEDYKPYSVTIGTDGSVNITEHDLYEDDEVNRFEDEGV